MQVVCADRAISGRCYVILCLTLWTSGMRANDCIACNLPNYPANTVLQSKKLEVTHYLATTKKFMMFCQWRNKLLKTDTDSVFNGRVTTESNGLSCCTEQTDDSQVWLCGGHMMVSINSSSGSVAINIALIYRARGARCTLLSNAQQWFLYMFLPLVFSWNHRKGCVQTILILDANLEKIRSDSCDFLDHWWRQMLSLTFPSGSPAHFPSLWLNDEVCCGSSRKKVLHSLQVSCIQSIVDDHIVADSWWQGLQQCSVVGLLLQHIATQIMRGKLPAVLVSL